MTRKSWQMFIDLNLDRAIYIDPIETLFYKHFDYFRYIKLQD